MKTQGTIIEIGEVQQVSDKFKKREIVLEIAENPSYPETVKFELQQDKVSLADKFSEGQVVEVEFNLRGRAWTDKKGVKQYFNTLTIWKIAETNLESKSQYATAGSNDDDDSSGLPF